MRSSVARPSFFILFLIRRSSSTKKQTAPDSRPSQRPPQQQRKLTVHKLPIPLRLHTLQIPSNLVCHVPLNFYILMFVGFCYARNFWRYSLGAAAAATLLIGPVLIVPKLRLLFWWAISSIGSPFLSSTLFCAVWKSEHLRGRYEYEFMNEIVIPQRVVADMEEQQDQQHQGKTQRKRELKNPPEPITIDNILHSSPNSPSRSLLPTERLPASPTTKTSHESVHTSTHHELPSHSRSSSFASTARESNRLSLSFPILPPNGRSSRPQSWINTSPITPAESLTSPTEGNFLTVLASQERRVLELKEELQKAEEELTKLKKQWSSNESSRKRNEVRRVQQLQPLSATIPSLDTTEEDGDGSSNWMQKEMERRKAILSGVKSSNRKVFSGSRHTRTLSLLSPEKTTFSPAYPHPSRRSYERLPPIRNGLTRSSTTSDIANAIISPTDDGPSNMDGSVMPKDALLKTGKQMASDIKDGLMNFFEDLRQVTVGDESVNGTGAMQPPTRTAGGRQTPRPGTINTRGSTRSTHLGRSQIVAHTRTLPRNDTLIDVGGSFWQDHGLETPQKPNRANKSVSKQTRSNAGSPLKSTESDEAWDIWGTPRKHDSSPPTSQSGSSLDSDHPETPSDDIHSTPLIRPNTSTNKSTRNQSQEGTLTPHAFRTGTISPTSTAHDNKKDAIPWPALNKLTPGNLKRTASHLMNEWEKSLSPQGNADSDAHTSDSGLDYGNSNVSPMPNQGNKVKKAD